MPKPRKCLPVSETFDTGNTQSDPDNLGDYDAVKKLAFEMLQGGGYWHDRIKRILTAAGFATRRIEQMESHPVWTMHLTRTTFNLAADQPTAAKQIRKVLVKGGIKIQRNELNIVSRSKDWIQCAFVLELGAPGVLN